MLRAIIFQLAFCATCGTGDASTIAAKKLVAPPGHLELVKYLETTGVDLKAKNNYGRTTAHLAPEAAGICGCNHNVVPTMSHQGSLGMASGVLHDGTDVSFLDKTGGDEDDRRVPQYGMTNVRIADLTRRKQDQIGVLGVSPSLIDALEPTYISYT